MAKKKSLKDVNNEIARINYKLAFEDLSQRKTKELLKERASLREYRKTIKK